MTNIDPEQLMRERQADDMASNAACDQLAHRILTQLPAQRSPLQQLWNWLLAPVPVAAMVTTFIVAVVMVNFIGTGIDHEFAQQDFEQWAWLDVTGQELIDDTTNNNTLTMMDLVELEFDDG